MKIGDKVRFLNEIGGGRVAGFQGKNIVLVEDEDGFQIPLPVNEVIAVDSDDYSTAKVLTKPEAPAKAKASGDITSIKHSLSLGLDEEDNDYDPSEKEITFKAPVEERKGGDRLSSYLAFVPMDIKDFSNSRVECYLVNDSNYSIRYSYLVAEGNSWQLRLEGELEPNTKTFVEELGREDLNDMQHIAIQMFAYKHDKPFLLKPAVDVQFRIDPVKFYKLHCFRPNDFFEQPAMLYTIIENDEMLRPLVIDSKKLKQEMFLKEKNEDVPLKKVVKKEKEELVVIDLHASELLDTTNGMSNADILEYQLKKFRETLSEYSNKKGQKIIVIHGKGEGVLRNAIINELTYKYKRYQYQDASFREYGYGATQVTIK